jgi:hypothetical protein
MRKYQAVDPSSVHGSPRALASIKLGVADRSAAWRRGQSVSLGCALFRDMCAADNAEPARSTTQMRA